MAMSSSTSSSFSFIYALARGGEDPGVAFALGLEDIGRLRFFEIISSSESSGTMKSSMSDVQVSDMASIL